MKLRELETGELLFDTGENDGQEQLLSLTVDEDWEERVRPDAEQFERIKRAHFELQKKRRPSDGC